MNSGRVQRLMIVAAVLSGCSSPPKISDTGYTGTWSRGNDHARSIIAIVNDGGTYRFRWTQKSQGGTTRVTCDWDGKCEQFKDDAKIATYVIDCRMDADKKHLMVKLSRTGTPRSPDTHTDLDELVVDSGGKRLRSFVVQHDAEHFVLGAGPTRYFDKVSDDVDDPPSKSRR